MKKMNSRILSIATLIVGVFVLLFLGGCTSENPSQSPSSILSGSEVVAIPLSEITTDVSFREHTTEGGTVIKYLVVMGSDGLPRVAFDACDVCGGLKGYRQDGGTIVCNNCGRRFAIDGLGTENKGYGCWPSHLPAIVEGDSIKIKVSDILDGESKF